MSKRSAKKRKQSKPRKPTPTKSRSESRRQSTNEGNNRRWAIIGASIILLILLGAGGYWSLHRATPATPPPSDAPPSSETPTAAPTPTLPPNIGPVTACVHRPAFVSQLNLGDQIYIGTNLRGYQGLTLSAKQADGQTIVYQHPSWKEAGNLAAYVMDKDGNIYLAPAPFVSLDDNPPDEQNTLFRVDTNTGVMEALLDLPAAKPITSSNPYGIMGLTYDCDSNSLYATSIAGSSYDEEVGRIFQIDLNTPGGASVASQLDGVDVFGLGVYRGAHGKRLYFGSARNSSIRSVALDKTGALGTEQRLEFYLLAAPGGGDDRAKRVQFPKDDAMLIKGIEFNYTLRAASDFKERDYTYHYQPATDTWEFEDVHWREALWQ